MSKENKKSFTDWMCNKAQDFGFLMGRIMQKSEDLEGLEKLQDRLYDDIKTTESKEVKNLIFARIWQVDKLRTDYSEDLYSLFRCFNRKYGRNPKLEGDPIILFRMVEKDDKGFSLSDRREFVNEVRNHTDNVSRAGHIRKEVKK